MRTILKKCTKKIILFNYGKKNNAELQQEISDLTDALKASDTEVKDLDEKITDLEKQIEKLDNKIDDLEYEIEQQPVFGTMIDQMKYDMFIENFDKFALEQFENFVKIGQLW